MGGHEHTYLVSRNDGKPIPPEAVFLILRLDTDPAGRAAALYYARLLQASNREEARHIVGLVTQLARPGWSPTLGKD